MARREDWNHYITPGESSHLVGVGNIVSDVLQPVEFHGFVERIFPAVCGRIARREQ